MKKFLFHLILFVSLLSCSFSAAALLSEKDYSVIINLSGKQRMLSQKMVKEVLLIALDTDKEKNRENLKGTVELFEKTLNGLRDGDASLKLVPTDSIHIRHQIDSVKLLFDEVEVIFRRIIAGEDPSRDALFELAEKNASLLGNMNTAVEMYEEEARDALKGDIAFLGVELNLAGKQRMLSQRMIKEALLIYSDIHRRDNKNLLRKTSALFERTLNGLKYGDGDLGLPGTTQEEVAFQIDTVMKTWKELKPIIEKSSDIMIDKVSREDIEKIAQLNILLLKEMDKVVTMYEALAQ